jgi:excinuclease UvrABC nuclease subunit
MELLDGKVSVWIQSAQFVKATPGVYVLYDKHLDAIYIGASENLQKTFEKYVNEDFENNPCKQKTRTYQRIFVENPKERKKQMLDEYEKEHGKIPDCNAETD